MESPLVFGATVDLLLRAHFYHLEHPAPNPRSAVQQA
jgi:hypothetical protein